jgi:hypothetical protein
MLTKKHFKLVASAIAATAPAQLATPSNQLWASGCDFARSYIARRLAAEFALENPAFDRARFLAACGVEDAGVPCNI